MMFSRALIAVSLAACLSQVWPGLRTYVRAQNSSEHVLGGDPIRGERIALSCARCHGDSGISSIDWIPSLAGMSQYTIYKQLDDYRSGRRRPEWYMASIAKALSLQDSADLSAYYEQQPSRLRAPAVNHHLPSGIASCVSCHNPRSKEAPQIAGQQSQYLEIQLSLFAQGIRTNDRNEVMRKIAGQLSFDQIRQLSETLGAKTK